MERNASSSATPETSMSWASGRALSSARNARSVSLQRSSTRLPWADAATTPGSEFEPRRLGAHHREADDSQADGVLDRSRGPVGDDTAAGHEDDAVGSRVRLFEVVSREEDGPAAVGEPAHRVPEVASRLHVHGGGGLVEDQQLRVTDERHGEAKALRLTCRESIHPPLLETLELRDADRVLDGERRGKEVPRHREQLTDLNAGHHPAVLQHRADQPARDRVLRGHAEHCDGSPVRPGESQEEGDRGRLAGAVRSEQCDRLAAADAQADVVDSAHSAVRSRHTIDVDCVADRGAVGRRGRALDGGQLCHALSLGNTARTG